MSGEYDLSTLRPDRSKFNRGKRYSFVQLLKQQAIDVELNEIPQSSVRQWSRDVQPDNMSQKAVDMLIRHYSLAGDGVLAVGCEPRETYGRKVKTITAQKYFENAVDVPRKPLTALLKGPYFKRFAVLDGRIKPKKPTRIQTQGSVRALLAESASAMRALPAKCVDAAVTSPPYYNAREYSQWPNIYCYLFDMLNNADALFRVLKPGGTYLFNIFDYFDNENNIALSAMGEKRLTLSAHCVHLFESVGFRCEGNIVWDKGEIEGKRAFNAGNFSPYYQAPFNCWEHILVFKKPGTSTRLTSPLPSIIREKAVIKMVRGENRHGHSAPFPEAIPRLLTDRLPSGAVLLDPYAGSMTTGRVAERAGLSAICIEQNEAYFHLGIEKLEGANKQGVLL